MPITPDHAGRTYTATAPYEVTSVKVTEFVSALGGTLRRAAPDGLEAPPTFAAVVVSPAWDLLFTDPDLELGAIVHAEQQLRWERPLRVGDVVTATLRLDKVRVRGTSEILASTIEVRDAADDVVLTASATFFHQREVA